MEDIDPRWRKSSWSGGNGGGCLEAGDGVGCVLVRDTMHPQWPHGAPVTEISRAKWDDLVARVKSGELDSCRVPVIG